MNPKLAYVDHMPMKSFLEALARAGIDFKPRCDGKPHDSIKSFKTQNDFQDFFVFLCHPGLSGQAKFEKVVQEYPHLKSAMITNLGYEYCEPDILIFDYKRPESVIKWILENQ